MKLLIDNALSPVVADGLRQADHDVVHVRDIGLQAASDDVILERAHADQRIIVSADTDFGTLLALRRSRRPSFVLLRRSERSPLVHAAVLVANLPDLEQVLHEGAVVVIGDRRIRVRRLPIGVEVAG